MAVSAPPIPRQAVRRFGRFELQQLLGKSSGTMVWVAFDTRAGAQTMLTMPRVQPHDAAALERWQGEAAAAARLEHPNLAPVAEVGVHEHWPYVAVDRGAGVTLPEWLAAHTDRAPVDLIGLLCQALQGLAFAHEAGVSHDDLQPVHLLIDEQRTVRLMGLASAGRDARTTPGDERGMRMEATRLRAHREMAERDVLACGLLLHGLLAGRPPLDQPDIALVIQRLPPHGSEVLRLPWTTPQPVPEALRTIANRATASQPRQRYLNARTLLQALDGWRSAEAQDKAGPLALLLDRIRSGGHLPAMPEIGGRVSRLIGADGQRNDEMAAQILHDLALSFELLRQVNSAQVQGTQVAGSAPVLTVRRAIALVGIEGVRRAAAQLRIWPGPLASETATAMQRAMERARLAGLAAQALCPAGYDTEVVFLVAALQNLGRLLLRYHFADAAEQIWQLMRPVPALPEAQPGTSETPGMSEAAASYAVLGVDLDGVGSAVARQWGLGDEMQHMMRRLPGDRAVRPPTSDADVLRTAASAANEAVDVLALLPPNRIAQGVERVAERYARALDIGSRDLQRALQSARDALRNGGWIVPPEQPTLPLDAVASVANDAR